jgi:mRNA interferase RelE/StbE
VRTLELEREAAKFLRRLPPKQARQIAAKIEDLRHDPTPNDAKALTDHPPFWRATAGEYRIIYRFDEQELRIPLIGRRNDADVYRRLRRRR